MKSSVVILGCLLISSLAHAGKESSGGGDMCEDRIKVIRDDLRSWIRQGGPEGLAFPGGVSIAHYSDQMLAQIDRAKISCVGPGDRGYPVTVAGTPKVCRFDQAGGGQITCDFLKFNATHDSDQYVLIHHEFAGLAGMEQPNKGDSNYAISNQISDYLEDVVVKRLAVKRKSQADSSAENTRFCISYFLRNESIYNTYWTYCPGQTQPIRTSDYPKTVIDTVNSEIKKIGYSPAGTYLGESVLLHVGQESSANESYCIVAPFYNTHKKTESRAGFVSCGDGATIEVDENTSVTWYIENRGYKLAYISEKPMIVSTRGDYWTYAKVHVYKKSR